MIKLNRSHSFSASDTWYKADFWTNFAVFIQNTACTVPFLWQMWLHWSFKLLLENKYLHISLSKLQLQVNIKKLQIKDFYQVIKGKQSV